MGVERPRVRIEPQPDQLGDAERDAAEHRAPERSEPAEHDDLERDQQALDAGIRRKGRAGSRAACPATLASASDRPITGL